MTENKIDIQTISTKRTDKQADRVLRLKQMTIEKDKADPSHFLKFLSQPACGTFAKLLKPTHDPSFAKEPNKLHAHNNYILYQYCQVKADFLTTKSNLSQLLFVSLLSG